MDLPKSRRAEFHEIPLIDIAALGHAGAAEEAVVAAIAQASRDVGFFYVSNHGVPEAHRTRMFAECERFYALPQAQREALKLTNSPLYRGYLQIGLRGANQTRARDLLEAFHVGPELGADDPAVRAGKPLHGPNQWPAALPAFREAILAYYDDMGVLMERLLQGFALAAGLPRQALHHQYRKPLTQMRLLHYPAQAAHVDDMLGARAHRDVGVFTILMQDDVGGLEVCNDAGEWIVAPPIPGTFVINVGEMLKFMTNDGFASALHRVVNRSGRERYSIPFFVNPDYDAVLTPLPSFGGAEAPAAPIHAGEHMAAFYRNLWPSAGAAAS